MSVENLIRAAQKEHLGNPVDAAHDYNHHEAVVKNIDMIIERENLADSVDIDTLHIAGWWHDYARGDLVANASVIRWHGINLGVDRNRIDEAIVLVETHSFGNKQETVAAQILYDADKIEYCAKPRYELAVDALRTGEISEKEFQGYVQIVKERMVAAYESLHFDSSREMFLNNLSLLNDYLHEVSECDDVVEFVDTDPQVQNLLELRAE